MSKGKIAITMDEQFIEEIDKLVEQQIYSNRSQAIQESVKEKLSRLKHSRLAEECAKLDKNFEKDMADEGLGIEQSQWPEY